MTTERIAVSIIEDTFNASFRWRVIKYNMDQVPNPHIWLASSASVTYRTWFYKMIYLF